MRVMQPLVHGRTYEDSMPLARGVTISQLGLSKPWVAWPLKRHAFAGTGLGGCRHKAQGWSKHVILGMSWACPGHVRMMERKPLQTLTLKPA